MSFRLSQEARAYFKPIDDRSSSGSFRSIWDKYYLCLMVGLQKSRLGKDTAQEQEFIGYFIDDYRDQRFEIVALFITAEINRRGLPSEEHAIRKLMLELLDPGSPTGLTEEGHRLLNKYAEGGFEIIREEIPDPSEFDMFIKKYYDAFVKATS